MTIVRMANGREIVVPTDSNNNVDVQELRHSLGVPNTRALVRQVQGGRNVVVPKKGTVEVSPYDYYTESARAIRGDHE